VNIELGGRAHRLEALLGDHGLGELAGLPHLAQLALGGAVAAVVFAEAGPLMRLTLVAVALLLVGVALLVALETLVAVTLLLRVLVPLPVVSGPLFSLALFSGALVTRSVVSLGPVEAFVAVTPGLGDRGLFPHRNARRQGAGSGGTRGLGGRGLDGGGSGFPRGARLSGGAGPGRAARKGLFGGGRGRLDHRGRGGGGRGAGLGGAGRTATGRGGQVVRTCWKVGGRFGSGHALSRGFQTESLAFEGAEREQVVKGK